jgi:hypothetical protein
MGRGPLADRQATVICTGFLLLPNLRQYFGGLNQNSVIRLSSATHQPFLGQSHLLTEDILEALPPSQIMK